MAPIGAFAGTGGSSSYRMAFCPQSHGPQAQTLVLCAGVGVVTVDESVVTDEGDYLLVAWQMLRIMLLL